GAPPLDVDHRLQSPCYIGHDEPGLNFLSNGTYSGSRVQFVVQLPASGSNAANAFSTFWIGMWLGGVRCSLLGESYLEIQINPPFSDVTTNGSANWTVQAPVWDLVPAGSCDPQCTNDTALTTIGGVGYCEDDAALSGIGTYTASGWGGFAPGDLLSVAMVGEVNGTTGLHVYLNDTTNLTRSLAWTYSASVSTSGLPLTPYYNTSSWSSGGWGYGLNVEATWENCPEAQGLAACNSYNGPSVNATGVPQVVSADYWNASSASYSNPFPWTATTSSAGACSGLAAPCYDFRTWGGTGQYPYWSIHAFGGHSWWTYGGSYPFEVNNFGGVAGQFNPAGYIPVLLDPTSIYRVETSVGAGTISLNAQVADPNGVSHVRAGATWCFTGASLTTRTSAGTLAGGPYDTNQQGNWSMSFPTNGFTGTFHYWVQGQSASGLWSPASYRNLTVGAGSTCSLGTPATPTFTASNITAAGIGYFLNWSEKGQGVTNFTVWVNSTTNGTPTPHTAGAVQSASVFVDAGAPNQTYHIAIVAYNLAGTASAATAWVLAPATLPMLQASLTVLTPTPLWAPSGPVSFELNASGGTAPYSYRIIFGDGYGASLLTNNTSVRFTHDYLGYFGLALAAGAAWDAQKEFSGSSNRFVPILATPLGVPSQASAGDGVVNITWSAPASPSGAVTHYTVYYTENAAWAWALGSFWPYNYSAPYQTFLWNTTHDFLRLNVPDGKTLYAQVIAWNAYGLGELPSANALLSATPAVLTIGPVNASTPGGAAPLTEAFTAFVVGGTGDVVTNASYSFSFGTEVGASIAPSGPSPNGTFWVNATYTFPSPGLAPVVLHVLDQFLDIAIATTSVSVAPGSGPSVNLTSTPGPIWVAEVVNFSVVASSGSGAYSAEWNFGDGVLASGLTVNHSYSSAGSYGATAWVTDTGTGGLTVRPAEIIVYALPQVAIDTNAFTNGTLSFLFTAIYSGGTGNATFVWTTSNDLFGRGATFAVTFSTPGAYAVQVTAVDDSGRHAVGNATVVAELPGGGGSGGGSGLSGTSEALLFGLGVLALLFLIGMIYFWSRSGKPPEEPPAEPAGAESG
ncbi:MAG: PKD domain-containing protein, partial [Thermoplasmata archaeon]|nr:PKD domain-containing protein [Thermoplasmata archaeon]